MCSLCTTRCGNFLQRCLRVVEKIRLNRPRGRPATKDQGLQGLELEDASDLLTEAEGTEPLPEARAASQQGFGSRLATAVPGHEAQGGG